MSRPETDSGLLTFGGHLDILRKMLFRILCVVIILAGVIFCFKTETFAILLAPHYYDFCTFRSIESLLQNLGWDFHFTEYHIPLISTELSAQFMTHITVSCLLAALLASPYILFELFGSSRPLYMKVRSAIPISWQGSSTPSSSSAC